MASAGGARTSSRQWIAHLRDRPREALALLVIVASVLLLIWNGSALFRGLAEANGTFAGEIRAVATTLTLNVALILFGWRHYADLQHAADTSAEHERRAAVLASTDPTTGLYNRKGFSDRAEAVARDAAANGQRLAIISLLVHRFKSVNEQHGFDIGDLLLRQLGDSLRDLFRGRGCIARVGGAELAVALPLAAGEIALLDALADKAIAAISRPYLFDDRLVQLGAFAGIAVASPDTRIPDLLRRADIAMDRAHNSRVARPVWFDAGMERALIAQSEIEQGIRFGLEHEQFVPFFEPQVDLTTGKVVGFEVLARWNHPLTGMIEPDQFIPVAEESGLIGRLSEQVIAQALKAAAGWEVPARISVNISPTQLTDGWLAQRVVKLLAECSFPADRLVVEITESALFTDVEFARSIATSLKNQGIQLALDDFGTGFSSLSHLRTLPFDIIKVDRSFVSTLAEKKESAAIVRAVTTLAGAIGVPVCIEGIENEATYRAVLDYGCDVGQGWYLGKPMTASDARAMLIERRREVPSEEIRSEAG